MPNSVASKREAPTLAEFIRKGEAELRKASIDNPALDARLLIAHALRLERAQLLSQSERVLSPDEIAAIEEWINRRARREPVARILGLREFWSLPFGLNEATLEPRPDTETLVEVALKLAQKDRPLRLLDLGTGTGCLLLALLHELPQAIGLGLDIAPRAVEQAQANASRLSLNEHAAFRVNNWLDGIDETFDLILSNPPYIRSEEIGALMPEVRNHDPARALDGGTDGLDAYRHLIPLLPARLNKGGAVVFEVGHDQAASVSSLFRNGGFSEVTAHKDLNGIERCVLARL